MVIWPVAGTEPPRALGLVVQLRRRHDLRPLRPDQGGVGRRGAAARRHRRPRPLHPADRGDAGEQPVRPPHPRRYCRRRGHRPPRAGARPLAGGRPGGHQGSRMLRSATGRRSSRGRTAASCSSRVPSPSSSPACARWPRPTWPARSRRCRRPGAASSPPRSTTRSWPTCSRRCRKRTRSGCSNSLGSLERSADVVEEMQPDDAADLLGEMPPEQRERLLTAMQAVQADDLRRLLRYDKATAGGLMTSQPLVFAPDTAVAEVLARVRDRDLPGDHGRAGLRVRAADADADRPLPGQRRVPAAAAPRAVHPDRRVHRGARLRQARACPSASWPRGWPLTTSSGSRCATASGGLSARLPSMTCSTGCCRSAGGGQEATA